MSAHWNIPNFDIHSLKLTANAPENRPFAPKGSRRKSSNHPFSGANLLLVLGRVTKYMGLLALLLFKMIIWLVVSNIFYFHPYLGKWSNLTNIFQMGWNHQSVISFAFFLNAEFRGGSKRKGVDCRILKVVFGKQLSNLRIFAWVSYGYDISAISARKAKGGSNYFLPATIFRCYVNFRQDPGEKVFIKRLGKLRMSSLLIISSDMKKNSWRSWCANFSRVSGVTSRSKQTNPKNILRMRNGTLLGGSSHLVSS